MTHLMPLYVFDERSIELSGLPGYKREGKEARTRVCGFWRTGVFRARSVSVRSALRGCGGICEAGGAVAREMELLRSFSIDRICVTSAQITEADSLCCHVDS